jgi:hypothetical protein
MWASNSVQQQVAPQLKRLVAGFLPRSGFEPRSGHVWCVVDKVARGHIFPKYFDFPCQFSFHRLLHIHHLSFGTGTIGQTAADIPSELSLTTPTPRSLKKELNSVQQNNPPESNILSAGQEISRLCCFRPKCNLFISSSFSLSQHTPAVHGHHRVLFCQKLFHYVVHLTSSVTYKCDISFY